MREAGEPCPTTSICLPSHLDEGREIAYSGIYKWKLDSGPVWIIWGREVTGPELAWIIATRHKDTPEFVSHSTTFSFPSLKQLQPLDISHRGTCLKFSVINSWHLSYFYLNLRGEKSFGALPNIPKQSLFHCHVSGVWCRARHTDVFTDHWLPGCYCCKWQSDVQSAVGFSRGNPGVRSRLHHLPAM